MFTFLRKKLLVRLINIGANKPRNMVLFLVPYLPCSVTKSGCEMQDTASVRVDHVGQQTVVGLRPRNAHSCLIRPATITDVRHWAVQVLNKIKICCIWLVSDDFILLLGFILSKCSIA